MDMSPLRNILHNMHMCTVIPQYKFVDIPVAKQLESKNIKGVKGVGIDQYHDDHYEDHDGFDFRRRHNEHAAIEEKLKSPQTSFINRHTVMF